ncbi:uncharacterized protein [Parasteatoda tepidariorum]|uniref:uncharacterized protein n=1 Tax=Parasteatoda tepidariorum TaxID=114398 RepID=UPI0039BD61F4
MLKQETLTKFFSEEIIEWKFLPPRVPNFGGSCSESIKSYLKRVVSYSNLTYGEFLTVLDQVKAMLNLRPLTPLSSDIEDSNILTPGHFLVGRSLTSIVEPTLLNISENRLNLWQKTTKAVQLILKNWGKSHLSTLQQRTQWMFSKQNVKNGNMDILRKENVPTSTWILGSIIQIYPGKDNNIRVVDFRTKCGIFNRTISKLCVLPLEE